MLHTDITTPAMAGPTTRPRFHCTELRPMADGTSSAGTMSGTAVCQAGKPMAEADPLSNASTAIQPGVARPVATIHVSTPAISAAASDAEMMRYWRRTRSANAPPNSPTIAVGTNPAAATRPAHFASPVVSCT